MGLTVCNVIAFSIYAAFLPLHAAAHGLSAAQIGIVFTGGAVAFVIGQDVLRRLSHRVQAERVLVPAFIARGLGVAVVPLLSSFSALLLANFLTGVVVAAIPLALSMRIAGQAPRGHLVAAMGGFNASADLGFFVGPVIGGLLAGFGLPWAFGLAIPITGAALLLLRRRTSDEPIDHHRPEKDS